MHHVIIKKSINKILIIYIITHIIQKINKTNIFNLPNNSYN